MKFIKCENVSNFFRLHPQPVSQKRMAANEQVLAMVGYLLNVQPGN